MSDTGQPAGSQLERLNSVQTLDLELDAIKLEETSIPGDLKKAREDKEQLETTLARTREDHTVLRREYSSADLELKDLSAKRDKAKTDQKMSGSAKEQSQYEAVIIQLSNRIEDLENESLPLVEKLEVVEGRINGLEEAHATLLPRLSELEGMDENRIAALRERYGTLMAQRNDLAEEVDFKLLRDYDTVRKAKKGIGLVLLRTGGKCGGCNAVLPLNVQQRVRSGAAGVKCQSCGRLLWSGLGN